MLEWETERLNWLKIPKINFTSQTVGVLITLTMLSAFYFKPPVITDVMERIELVVSDIRFLIRGPQKPGKDVVIAAIDEKSIDQLGRWPWPYTVQAKLVNRLKSYGARVITYDVVFSSSDTSGGINNLKQIKAKLKAEGVSQNSEGLAFLDRAIKDADHDAIFARALKSSRRTILGYFFQFDASNIAHLNENQMRQYLANIRNSKYSAIKKSPGMRLKNIELPRALAVESNIDLLAKSARGGAFFNLSPDVDGAIRRYPLIVQYRDLVEVPGEQDYLFAPIAVRTLERFLRGTTIFWIDPVGVEKVAISGRKKIVIPTNARGEMLINYLGPAGTFPQYSIVDIVNGRKNLAPPSAFKRKMVLIGPTAIALADLRVTPFDKAFPGVNIHATVIDNMLSNKFLGQPWWSDIIFDFWQTEFKIPFLGKVTIPLPFVGYTVGSILALGLLSTLILHRVGALGGGLWAIIGLTSSLTLNQNFFVNYGWWLNVSYPILTIITVYASMTVFHYVIEQRDKRFIQSAFGTYLSPKVVAELVENPDFLKLGGERKEITAFFSDVAGFTSVSESLSPEELVHLLNEYLSEMTAIILDYDGTVDKYEGDAIIAFFGAPHPMPDHAARCSLVALDMQKKLIELRAGWKSRDMKELHVRIGLNTGPAVVGNMGSNIRMDYTMMGDTVNSAARFEGANKEYGSSIMIGQGTYEGAKDFIEARELDLINVVGKTEPVPIYELIARKGEISPEKAKVLENYQAGLELYRTRQFADAMGAFSQGLVADQNDGPSKTMVKRCEYYMLDPPPKDWNGAFVMTSK